MRFNVARHGLSMCVPYKYTSGFILFVVAYDSGWLTASESVCKMVAWMILLKVSMSVRGTVFPQSGPSPSGTPHFDPVSSSPQWSLQMGNELGYFMLEY